MVIYNKKISGATLVVLICSILLLAVIFVLSRQFLPWWLFIIPLIMLLMLSIRGIDNIKPETAVEIPPEPAATAAPQIVILITGPWAARWFDKQQSALGSRFDHQITWLLTPSAADIQHRLEKLRQTDRPLDISLFFAFLPDGFENESIMISQLTAWKNSLFCLNLKEKLPCILAIYARLSHERKSHNPDCACWTGDVDLSRRADMRVAEAIDKVLHDVETDSNRGSCYSEQRNAMMTMLFLWMKETKIDASLASIFEAAGPLTLSHIMVADHGYGFSRHGAWSNWLCGKYGLLPGLSASLLRPPLPVLSLPVQSSQEPLTVLSPPLPDSAALTTAHPWLIGSYVTVLLLSFILLLGVWKQNEIMLKAEENIFHFRKVDVDAVTEKIARAMAIKQDKSHLSACAENSLMNRVLFTRQKCERLLNEAEHEITEFYTTPLYQSVSLFAKGSAVLTAENEKSLTVLIPVITQNPETRFLIIGHSDNTGTPEFNQTLSLQRALAVRDWLVRKTHSSETRFITEGAADKRPVATNLTEDGRKLNRRVEIKPLP